VIAADMLKYKKRAEFWDLREGIMVNESLEKRNSGIVQGKIILE